MNTSTVNKNKINNSNMVSSYNSNPRLLSVTFDTTSSNNTLEKQNLKLSSVADNNTLETQHSICSYTSDGIHEEGSCSSFDFDDYSSTSSSSTLDPVNLKTCRWHDSACSCQTTSENSTRRVSFGTVTIREYSEPKMERVSKKIFGKKAITSAIKSTTKSSRKKATTNSSKSEHFVLESTTVFDVLDYEKIRPKHLNWLK